MTPEQQKIQELEKKLARMERCFDALVQLAVCLSNNLKGLTHPEISEIRDLRERLGAEINQPL
jgi:hypothetical protein